MKSLKKLILLSCLVITACSLLKYKMYSGIQELIFESYSPELTYKVEIFEKVSLGKEGEEYGNHEANFSVFKKQNLIDSFKIDEGDHWDSLFQNKYKQIRWLRENVFTLNGMTDTETKDKIFVKNDSNQEIKFLSLDTTVQQKYFGIEIQPNDEFSLEMFPHKDYVELTVGIMLSKGRINKTCTFGLNAGVSPNGDSAKKFEIIIKDNDINI